MGNYKYISLFSGGGIGDWGLKKAGLHPIVMNELASNRAEILRANYKTTTVIDGDICEKKEEIIKQTRDQLNGERLFLLIATPPCQGMSKNGIGTIKKAIREGKRSSIDERNYLFLQVLDILDVLKPDFFVWENVDRMFNTYIVNSTGETVSFVDEFRRLLHRIGYTGTFEIHNMADFGVPQNRRRTIGVFVNTRLVKSDFNIKCLIPKPSFSKDNYRTVQETIGNLPPLDSKDKQSARSSFHPLHYVPVSRSELYYWIENTAPGRSAFENNTCPKCGTISSENSVLCDSCGQLLPKPTILKNGEYRLIKGFVSTYKRMRANEPAPTITTRSAYACSDQNLHPYQNRVLSLYEVALLFGLIPEEYDWTVQKGTKKVYANSTLLRDIMGEPVSPVFTQILGKHLKEVAISEFVK